MYKMKQSLNINAAHKSRAAREMKTYLQQPRIQNVMKAAVAESSLPKKKTKACAQRQREKQIDKGERECKNEG